MAARDLRGLVGLTEEEARRRLALEGANELPAQKKRGAFRVALEVIREPMFLMLVAAGALYVFMGEPGDAAVLLGFVVVVMTITSSRSAGPNARWMRCGTCRARGRS